jgi:hypothetical protein
MRTSRSGYTNAERTASTFVTEVLAGRAIVGVEDAVV